MQRRHTTPHRGACFGPNFRLNATAADGAGSFSAFKKEHLGATPLRRRSSRVGNSGHHHALATLVRLIDQLVEFLLRDGSHDCGTDFSLWFVNRLTQTEVCAAIDSASASDLDLATSSLRPWSSNSR